MDVVESVLVAYWAMLFEEHLIGASSMQDLKLPYQVTGSPANSFWNLRMIGHWILACYFVFTKYIVSKWLNSRFEVDVACEDIVQAKLSGEYVHQDVSSTFVVFVKALGEH